MHIKFLIVSFPSGYGLLFSFPVGVGRGLARDTVKPTPSLCRNTGRPSRSICDGKIPGEATETIIPDPVRHVLLRVPPPTDTHPKVLHDPDALRISSDYSPQQTPGAGWVSYRIEEPGRSPRVHNRKVEPSQQLWSQVSLARYTQACITVKVPGQKEERQKPKGKNRRGQGERRVEKWSSVVES